MENEQKKKNYGSVENLLLFQKFESFIKYFEPIIERFPRYEHFALCTDIKQVLHRTIELIIVTNRSRNKLSGLYNIDTQLEILRFYVRYSYSKGSKYLSFHSYETAEKKLTEIGCILGGLIKKIGNQ